MIHPTLKDGILQMLRVNIQGHLDASYKDSDYNKYNYLLDVFTCEECNKLRRQLEEILKEERE
ncbi:MAG: hypothetical protein AABY07_00810 [Nanoarchaeota archaeon]